MLFHPAHNYMPVVCILPFGITERFDQLETIVADRMLKHNELIFVAFPV